MTSEDNAAGLSEITSDFLEALRTAFPMLARHVCGSAAKRPELFDGLAAPMLSWARGLLGARYPDALLDGYCEFVGEVNRAQVEYEQRGHYEHRSYDEVFSSTYDSADFMDTYHWGVYVTTFAWEHHLLLYRFFRDCYLPLLPAQAGATLLDLGAGSGIWHMLTLGALPGLSATAVDISETSVELSSKMAGVAGLSGRIRHVCADALDIRLDAPADCGISCFLMEHLEQPRRLLQNLAGNLAPHACAFVTCALTAAEIDHIYEFTSECQPMRMAEEAGFRVVGSWSASPATHPAACRFLPRSLALILQKRRGEIW